MSNRYGAAWGKAALFARLVRQRAAFGKPADGRFARRGTIILGFSSA
ncbi:MAG: hypothetical protein KGQ26_03745 [Rhodospirillales bacterium]|nr:hypothetical protein [Rhodospirillales bacterium]MDE2320013.1 hypothetical protein [Rhodospirillales bacterium]